MSYACGIQHAILIVKVIVSIIIMVCIHMLWVKTCYLFPFLTKRREVTNENDQRYKVVTHENSIRFSQ